MFENKLGIRLKEERLKANKTQEQIATLLGVTRGAYSHFENDRNQPDMNTLSKLATYYNVTTDYLLGRTDKVNDIEVLSISKSSYQMPIYGKIVASSPEGASEEIEGVVEIQSDVIEKYGEKNLIALRVNGDSMNRIIPDRAIAILHKTEDISPGDICAVIINGYEATLKHVYKTPNRIIFEPDSYNKDHKAFEYTDDMDIEVKIIGKYLYAILGR